MCVKQAPGSAPRVANRIIPAPILIWFSLAGVLAFALFLRWPTGGWLSTDFYRLLPDVGSDHWEVLATERSSSAYEQQLVLMASGPDAAGFLDRATQRLAQAGYADPDFEQDQAQLWARLADVMVSFARGLVTTADKHQLVESPSTYLEHFRGLLYSPLGGSWLSSLPEDPLGLFQNFLTASLPIEVPAQTTAQLTFVQIPEAQLGFNNIAGLYGLYQQLSVSAREEGIAFHALGTPLYSAYGVKSGRSEVSTIGAVSISALILLLWLTIRSPAGLLLTLLVVVCGVGSGLAITLLICQQIHLLALVFGATLIGIAADYAFHYLCHSLLPGWRPDDGLTHVHKGLILGVVSSSLGFSALALMPFPGLQQIGIFMAGGLLCSFITVRLLFPSLYRPTEAPGFVPALFQSAPTAGRLPPLARTVVLIVIILPGLYFLHPQDDVRDFYAVPADLEIAQAAIADASGGGDGSRYLLLRARGEEELLGLEERLLSQVAGLRAGITAIVPSKSVQLETVDLQRKLAASTEVQSFLREMGFNAGFIKAYRSRLAEQYEPLSISNLEGLELPLGTGGFLGCDQGDCASWLTLNGVTSERALLQAVSVEPGVELVDPVAGINAMLTKYRRALAVLLLVATVLVTGLLWIALNRRAALQIVVLPVSACLLSLASIGFIQGSYSIINLLALLLVAGIGLDFAIFRQVSSVESQGATRLAVTLSAMTSVLAFGMLALSETPIIRDFGLSIGSGLLFAWGLFWIQAAPGTEDGL